MTHFRVVTPRIYRRAIAAATMLLCLLASGGCKTSDDAAAAATQLTATAKSLTDYYSALETMLTESDQLNTVQEVLYGIPYDAPTKAVIADTKAEMHKRAELAKALSELAQSFAKLTSATSSTDAANSASSLETEVESLNLTQSKLSDNERSLMKLAIGQVVTAIQEHKEREAARGIDQFTVALSNFFAKEESDYQSIGDQYAVVSHSLAVTLLQRGQTDPSGFFKVALDPYGLTPEVSDPTLKAKIGKIAEQQADQKAADLQTAQKLADAEMEKSLKTMADRIHLVATGKPMELRIPPVTVANVEKWASQFIALIPSTTTGTN